MRLLLRRVVGVQQALTRQPEGVRQKGHVHGYAWAIAMAIGGTTRINAAPRPVTPYDYRWGFLPCSNLLSSDMGWYNRTERKWAITHHPNSRHSEDVVEKSPVSLSSRFSKESYRKGAKRIHNCSVAKKSLNESRKSTIQKVVALTAHSKSSEHSSSSSKHKKSNGSTRSETDKEKEECYCQEDSSTSSLSPKSSKPSSKYTSCQEQPKGTSFSSWYASSHEKEIPVNAYMPRFCHGSVDTPIDGVDTGLESLKLFHENRVNVSTQSVVVSTLDPASRRPFWDKWDSVSTHSVVVSTHSG
ncbi:hypothetical protein Taro_044562 [Colocasia esculenta]|uniref:Uncharacterized protein n=1 Tax=Colocasia esculenta TaxID=4460 RepID=A0A843WM90_COLES|nr:hypothetical protein [Colocasia esculenta]